MSPSSSSSSSATTYRCLEVVSTDPLRPLAERLQIRQREQAPLGPHEVRIGMLAMTILPADGLQMNRQYGHQPPLPYVPGHEGVAVVLACGTAVLDLTVGERVLPTGVFGLWSDELVVPRRKLIALPAHGDVLQQAMLTANPATAWVLLQHQASLAPGQWVIQNAANSAVGQCVRQLAAHLGIPLLNVVRRASALPSDAQGHWLVDEGHAPEAFKAKAAHITGGQSVVLALDAVGGVASQALASALSSQGRLVLYGLLSGAPCQVSAHDLVFRGIQVQGFWLAHWFSDLQNKPHSAAVFPALMALAQQGVLQMAVEKVYELGDALQAVQHAARSERQGKVLLQGWHARSLLPS